MIRTGAGAVGAVVAAAVLALLGSGGSTFAAPVVPTPFSLCDGFGAPTTAGDGMTAEALAFLIFVPSAASGDTTKAETKVGAPGIAACDQALADPHLAARFWLRRVNLLRAKAMHEIAAGHVAVALAVLEEAEAAAQDPADPYYRRSLGLGIQYVRAYALRQAGRTAEARDLVMKTWAERPYNRESVISARIVLGDDASEADRETLTRALARQSPPAGDELFIRAFEQGRFADAAALFDGLSPPVRSGDEPMSDDTRFNLELINNRISSLYWGYRGGQTAYAYASTGDAEAARAIIKRVRSNLENATRLPTFPANKKGMKRLAAATEANAVTTTETNRAIDAWSSLVERRLLLADGKVDDVLSSLKTNPLPRNAASVEFVDALLARLPADRKTLAPALMGLKVNLQTPPKKFPERGLGDLLQSLPDAETRDRVARYGGASAWWSTDGFSTEEHPDGGFTTVTFRGVKSSGPIVEELALLRAADLARKAGKKGFIVLRRKDLQHSQSNTMYGQVMATFQTGYETRLDVVLVDPTALPAGLEHANWRVLDADEVFNALAPIYAPDKATKKP